MAAKNEHGLTPQQEHFAQLVGGGSSGVDAYRKAYPKAIAWKDESVRVEAAKMLANPNISQRVKRIQADGAELAGLDSAKIAAEIAKVAHSDIGGIMDESGRVKLPNELDAGTRAAVKSFKIDEFGRIEYSFWDKNAALTNAAKITGMFEKDNKQKTDPLVEFLANLSGNVIGPTPADDPSIDAD